MLLPRISTPKLFPYHWGPHCHPQSTHTHTHTIEGRPPYKLCNCHFQEPSRHHHCPFPPHRHSKPLQHRPRSGALAAVKWAEPREPKKTLTDTYIPASNTPKWIYAMNIICSALKSPSDWCEHQIQMWLNWPLANKNYRGFILSETYLLLLVMTNSANLCIIIALCYLRVESCGGGGVLIKSMDTYSHGFWIMTS